MTTSAQQHNLQELIVALQGIKEGKEPILSKDLILLLTQGLHDAHLPESLHVGAAENFHLTFQGIGGLARQMLWADKNYGAFMKLYARQTGQTIAPLVPRTIEDSVHKEWPDWLTQRRLAYQEEQVAPGASSDDNDGDDA